MKNYVVFVNDHSGSMQSLSRAAISDYNAQIGAVRDAANAEMMDTVVSVIGFGYRKLPTVRRQVQISNPHVLRPISTWDAEGYTPLYDGIMEGINLIESLPDISNPDVSVLFVITTDGGENSSGVRQSALSAKIASLQASGRWTFTARVPNGHQHQITSLGVPSGNVQVWETTAAGMAQAQARTTEAIKSFTTLRASGVKSSNTFYAQAAAVDTSKLIDISSKTSLYVVGQDQMGILIKDFILTKRMEYLIGAAFYQLTKTEPRVSPTKLILIREKTTGKVFAGNDARKMIGLDTVNNARLHPGDHGAYDIFIQSESWNRKLVAGSGVLYWAEKGRPMTQADLDKYAGQNNVPAAPAVPQLLNVAPTNKPTPSPIPVAKKPDLSYVNGRKVYGVYDTRQDARRAGASTGRFVKDIKDFPGNALEGGKRWFLFE